MRISILMLIAAVVLPTVAIAQQGDSFTGVGPWRSIAPGHYYSGKCCYCLPAEAQRPAGPDQTEYLVRGTWYKIPNAKNLPPDPNKPTTGIIICDPIREEYECAIIHPGV